MDWLSGWCTFFWCLYRHLVLTATKRKKRGPIDWLTSRWIVTSTYFASDSGITHCFTGRAPSTSVWPSSARPLVTRLPLERLPYRRTLAPLAQSILHRDTHQLALPRCVRSNRMNVPDWRWHQQKHQLRHRLASPITNAWQPPPHLTPRFELAHFTINGQS